VLERFIICVSPRRAEGAVLTFTKFRYEKKQLITRGERDQAADSPGCKSVSLPQLLETALLFRRCKSPCRARAQTRNGLWQQFSRSRGKFVQGVARWSQDADTHWAIVLCVELSPCYFCTDLCGFGD
jgi:hypothetical protein